MKEYSTYIGDFSFKVREGQFIRVTWDGKRLGKKKDFVSKLKCVDQTHFFGIAPWCPSWANNWLRCKDLWHTYYVPYKDCIKSVEVIPA